MGCYLGTLTNLIKTKADEPFTWKESGIHFATLNAAARRGLVVKEGTKYRLLPKAKMFAALEQLFAASNADYISLKKKGAPLGMLCSLKGFDILDAWDKPWEYIETDELQIFNTDTQQWEDLKY